MFYYYSKGGGNMYEMIPYILGIVFILLGAFMALMPRKSVKKEDQNSEEELKKTRRNGIIVAILGVVLIIIGFIQPK